MMGFQPLERITVARGVPSLAIGRSTGGNVPFVQINRAALEAMGFDAGDTAKLVLAWDPENLRLGVMTTKDDTGRYLRVGKVNKSLGIKLSIAGEAKKYDIPIDDIVGRHPLTFDKESGYWVADCGRGINRGAIRNRLHRVKGVES